MTPKQTLRASRPTGLLPRSGPCRVFALILVAVAMLAGCETVQGLQERIRPGADTESADGDALILSIERKLQELGYSPGTVDGFLDARTEAAIQDFQLDEDLRIDGRATPTLLEALNAAANRS